MTDDADVCGHPTEGGDGPPCQHPTTDDGDPDRCWEDSHNGTPTDADQSGRPTEFDDETARAAIDAVPEQKTIKGVEAEIGLGEGTLNKWLQKDLTFVDDEGNEREFFNAFRQARAGVMAELVNGPLYDPPEETPPDYQHMNGQHARYLLASSYGLIKTEKREHEDTTDGGFGGGTEIVVTGEYDPNPNDGDE